MGEVDCLAVTEDGTWLVMDLSAGQFRQTAEGPEVMITGEEMDVNAFFDESAYLSAEGVILMFAFVVDVILHPEIEHVSEHVDGNGVLAHLLEEVDEFFLVRPAFLDSQAA